MQTEPEISTTLYKHLTAILENDLIAYHETTSPDLTLYEWWITPHRINGLPFHDFLMTENARLGTVFGAELPDKLSTEKMRSRFDLPNLLIQQYGDTAIATYTLLISSTTSKGVQVVAHNESRVLVKINGSWQVVHVHKSPAWQAPHTQSILA